MPLRFIYREPGNPDRIAVFPGAWNPPTLAHLEIARAARSGANEVVWVLPRSLPHKQFEGASFEDRCRMLGALMERHAGEGFSAAVSDRGLYAEIAEETRDFFGGGPEIALLCGRDAAERMATWNYSAPGVFERMLGNHRLLVAARGGEYEAAAPHRERITAIPMDADWNEVSSTEVRRRVATGEDWRSLAPPELAELIQDLYGRETKL